jgi:hypothetical protein
MDIQGPVPNPTTPHIDDSAPTQPECTSLLNLKKPAVSTVTPLALWKKEPVFFSGTSERIIPNHLPKSRILSPMEDPTIIDTTESIQMILHGWCSNDTG